MASLDALDGYRPGDVAVYANATDARAVVYVADRRGRASVVESVSHAAGLLHSCGVVRAGDVLVAINRTDVSTATFDDVQQALGSVTGRVRLVFRPPGQHYHLGPGAAKVSWRLDGGVLHGALQVRKRRNPVKPWMTRYFVFDGPGGRLRRYHSFEEWRAAPDSARDTPLSAVARVEDATLKDNARKQILRLNVNCMDGTVLRLRADTELACRVWTSTLALAIGQTGRVGADVAKPPTTPIRRRLPGNSPADVHTPGTTFSLSEGTPASSARRAASSSPSASPSVSPTPATPPVVPSVRRPFGSPLSATSSRSGGSGSAAAAAAIAASTAASTRAAGSHTRSPSGVGEGEDFDLEESELDDDDGEEDDDEEEEEDDDDDNDDDDGLAVSGRRCTVKASPFYSVLMAGSMPAPGGRHTTPPLGDSTSPDAEEDAAATTAAVAAAAPRARQSGAGNAAGTSSSTGRPPSNSRRTSRDGATAHYMLPTSASRARSPTLRRGSGGGGAGSSVAPATGAAASAADSVTGGGGAPRRGSGAHSAGRRRPPSTNAGATKGKPASNPRKHSSTGRGVPSQRRGTASRGGRPPASNWVLANGDRTPPRIRGGGGGKAVPVPASDTDTSGAPDRAAPPLKRRGHKGAAEARGLAVGGPRRAPRPAHDVDLEAQRDITAAFAYSFAKLLRNVAMSDGRMDKTAAAAGSAAEVEVEPGLFVNFTIINLLHIYDGPATKRGVLYDQAGPQGGVSRSHINKSAWATGLKFGVLPASVVPRLALDDELDGTAATHHSWVVISCVLQAGLISKRYRPAPGWDDGITGVRLVEQAESRAMLPIYHYTTDFTTPHATQSDTRQAQAARPGDVLLEVDGRSVAGSDIATVTAALRRIPLADGVMLKVARPELVRRKSRPSRRGGGGGGGSRASVASSASRSEPGGGSASGGAFVPHRAPKPYKGDAAAAATTTPPPATTTATTPATPATAPSAAGPDDATVSTVTTATTVLSGGGAGQEDADEGAHHGGVASSLLSPLSQASRGSRIPVRLASERRTPAPLNLTPDDQFGAPPLRESNGTTPGTPLFDLEAEMASGTPLAFQISPDAAAASAAADAGSVKPTPVAGPTSPSRIPRFSPRSTAAPAVTPPLPAAAAAAGTGPATTAAPSDAAAATTPVAPAVAPTPDTVGSAASGATASPALQSVMTSPTAQLAHLSLGAVQRVVLLSEAPSTADLLRKLGSVKRQLHSSRASLSTGGRSSCSPNPDSVASTAVSRPAVASPVEVAPLPPRAGAGAAVDALVVVASAAQSASSPASASAAAAAAVSGSPATSPPRGVGVRVSAGRAGDSPPRACRPGGRRRVGGAATTTRSPPSARRPPVAPSSSVVVVGSDATAASDAGPRRSSRTPSPFRTRNKLAVSPPRGTTAALGSDNPDTTAAAAATAETASVASPGVRRRLSSAVAPPDGDGSGGGGDDDGVTSAGSVSVVDTVEAAGDDDAADQVPPAATGDAPVGGDDAGDAAEDAGEGGVQPLPTEQESVAGGGGDSTASSPHASPSGSVVGGDAAVDDVVADTAPPPANDGSTGDVEDGDGTTAADAVTEDGDGTDATADNDAPVAGAAIVRGSALEPFSDSEGDSCDDVEGESAEDDDTGVMNGV